MKSLPALLLSVFSFSFCAVFSQTKQDNGLTSMPSIKLEVFPSTPKEIEGCSGLYSYASTAVEKQEYIFATKTEEFAIIRIKGKNISLKMVKTTEPARGIYKEVYEGNGYTAILTTKEVKKTGDEGALYVGTLEIRHGATKLVVKVHGESGC